MGSPGGVWMEGEGSTDNGDQYPRAVVRKVALMFSLWAVALRIEVLKL